MAETTTTTAGRPIARVLPLLSPAHLDRDFDYLVPPEFDEIAQPGVRVRLRFAGRLVDGYLLERLEKSEHTGKLVKLERVVSPERVLTPEILRLAVAVAARYAGTRADVLRLAIPPRHAGAETGKKPKAGKKAAAAAPVNLDADDAGDAAEPTESRGVAADFGGAEAHSGLPGRSVRAAKPEFVGRPDSASGVRHEPAGRPDSALEVRQESVGRPDSASGVRHEPAGRPDSALEVRQESVGRP
ncbi:primosomal protein N' family DNA-binding protein, partial [Nocardia goodfellowii]